MQYARKSTSTIAENQRLLSEACPLNDTLARVAMRWKMQILHSVRGGHPSFATLKRALPSVTDHVLARRLRELAEEGLLTKRARSNRRFVYDVTPRGEELLHVMEALCAWELRGRDDLAIARDTARSS